MRTGVQWLAHLCGTYLAQPVLFPFTLSGDLLQPFAQIEWLKFKPGLNLKSDTVSDFPIVTR